LTVVAIVLGIAIAVGAVLLVAWPFLKEPVTADDRLDALAPEDEVRLGLVEERDRGMTAFETPEVPGEPAPPPDEGTPPTPSPVPEPYPPPDEAEIPAPTPQE
jgi:outer membrane biosynthesis protein TonB